jgi:hypothetical protein
MIYTGCSQKEARWFCATLAQVNAEKILRFESVFLALRSIMSMRPPICWSPRL